MRTLEYGRLVQVLADQDFSYRWRWEFSSKAENRSFDNKQPMIEVFNALGQSGWQLTAIEPGNHGWWFVRPQ